MTFTAEHWATIQMAFTLLLYLLVGYVSVRRYSVILWRGVSYCGLSPVGEVLLMCLLMFAWPLLWLICALIAWAAYDDSRSIS